MIRPIVRDIVRPIVRSILGLEQRIFITADAVLNTNFTFSAVTLAGDFDVNIDAVLPTDATTYALYGQAASANNSIKVLSTGFVSIDIGGSTVTSTVLATKDSKLRNYGVKLIGNDFLFTESGATIDTVTDATAAANSLVLDAIGVSNGLSFFDNVQANPSITDITTPLNSESWKLDQAFPSTTEQSSSGSNLLTYVNAETSTRELFTLVGGDWLGVDLVTNGGFDSDTNWTKGANWAISSGFATHTPGASDSLTQSGIVVTGAPLSIKYTIFNMTQGAVLVANGDNGLGTPRTVDGTYTETVQQAGSNIFFIFANNSLFDGSVDDVSAKRILEVA